MGIGVSILAGPRTRVRINGILLGTLGMMVGGNGRICVFLGNGLLLIRLVYCLEVRIRCVAHCINKNDTVYIGLVAIYLTHYKDSGV